MTVTHFQRHPFHGNFSIERVFATVRRALANSKVDCRLAICRYNGTNPLRLAYNLVEAHIRCEGISHITGDVAYLAYILPKKTLILTVHDCVGMVRLHGWRRCLYRLGWLCLPTRCSALVTVVSEHTRRELIRYTGCPASKIRVVPDPVGLEFRPKPRKFSENWPTILQVGAGFNKNIGRVANALRGIACDLHIIGNLSADDREQLDGNEIRYRVSTKLTDEEVVRAYEACDLVLFASTYEGFGMPIIEANAVGRPVVTSNIEPMTSVAGTAACLVDPEDPASIRAGVLRIIKDEKYRELLVAEGLNNACRFSPAKVAQAYIAVYTEVFGKERSVLKYE